MIIKEKSIKSYRGLEGVLRYVLTKTSEEQGFIFQRFIKGDKPLRDLLQIAAGDPSRQSVIREQRISNFLFQFKENDKLRLHKRTGGVKFYHVILSFHASDRLTEAQLLKTARKYAKERFPRSLVVFIPHFDQDHLHCTDLLQRLSTPPEKHDI